MSQLKSCIPGTFSLAKIPATSYYNTLLAACQNMPPMGTCCLYSFLFSSVDVKPPSVPVQAPIEIPMSAGLEVSSHSHHGQLPQPYQLLNVPPLDSNSHEDPPDYLLLINCQSKKPEPSR